jgi:hypothetical protein
MRIPFLSREHSIEDALTAYTDALLAGAADPDQFLKPYNEFERNQIGRLLALVERLSRALVPVAPSEQFVNNLRHALLEAAPSERRTLWRRIRSLPPRTQIAAGIGGATLTAGVVLLASRSMPNPLEYWRNRRVKVA